MTPERIAELRRVHPAGHSFERTAKEDDECVICGLLDELEACQKRAVAAYQAQASQHRDEVELAGHLGMEAAVNQAIEQIAVVEAERDRLAAQVARLDDLLTQLWRADAVPNALLEDVEVALADTEAAATAWLEAHDREQRLAGARELAQRIKVWGDDVARVWECVDDMEREASA